MSFNVTAPPLLSGEATTLHGRRNPGRASRRAPAPRRGRRACHHGGVGDLELIDCGDGRRLERFGDVVVDRLAPGAIMPRRLSAADWRRAALRWTDGRWVRRAAERPPWTIGTAGLTLECRPAAGGQIGVFPEHASTWGWLDGAVRALAAVARPAARDPVPVRLHGRSEPRLRAGRCPRRPRGRLEAGRRLGAPERGGSRGSRIARSAGWSTTCGRSCAASDAGAGPTTASIADPPTYGHGRSPGRSTTTCRRSSTTSPRSLGPRPALRPPERAHARLRRRAAGRAGPRAPRASPRPPASCA